ncbi:hypothetical protein K438DRAFT_1765764 [Mycena galopus ATCC 62051]|nr:hypothetical protein K438DRAFT_1765764 [Mycena galopus ATCC 62051]
MRGAKGWSSLSSLGLSQQCPRAWKGLRNTQVEIHIRYGCSGAEGCAMGMWILAKWYRELFYVQSPNESGETWKAAYHFWLGRPRSLPLLPHLIPPSASSRLVALSLLPPRAALPLLPDSARAQSSEGPAVSAPWLSVCSHVSCTSATTQPPQWERPRDIPLVTPRCGGSRYGNPPSAPSPASKRKARMETRKAKTRVGTTEVQFGGMPSWS